jgi:hypothetical protein
VKCDTCDHNEVCSKKEDYKQAFDKVQGNLGEFEIELRCKNFKTISLFPRPSLNDYSIPNPWKTTGTGDSPYGYPAGTKITF